MTKLTTPILVTPLLVALFGLFGCTSSTLEEQVGALESELRDVRLLAPDAQRGADSAGTAAADARSAATEAQRLAQQALDEARDAAERSQRIADTCCGRK